MNPIEQMIPLDFSEELVIHGYAVSLRSAEFISEQRIDKDGNLMFDGDGEPLNEYPYAGKNMIAVKARTEINGRTAFNFIVISGEAWEQSRDAVISFLGKSFDLGFQQLANNG